MLSLIVTADGLACTMACLMTLTLLTTRFRRCDDMPDMLLLLRSAHAPQLLCLMMTAHEFGLFGGRLDAEILTSGQQAERAGAEWLGHAISA